MNAHTGNDLNRSAADETEAASLTTLCLQWVEELRLHLARLQSLVTLEARYSLWNIGLALGFILLGAVALLSTWGLLLAGLAMFLQSLGLPWPLVLTGLALLNLLLAVATWHAVQVCLGRVGFSRTARVLGLDEQRHVDS